MNIGLLFKDWKRTRSVDSKGSRAFLVCLLTFCLLDTASLAWAEDADIVTAKGIEKLQAGDYPEAARLLEDALRLAPDDAEANYYAGLAQARLGNYEAAEKLLRKSLERAPGSADAYFELCMVASKMSHCEQAGSYLDTLKQVSGDEDQVRAASEFVSGCGGGAAAEKPYYLALTAGGQYDTNVILEPSNPQVPSDKADFRGLLFLSAGATPLDAEAVAVDVDYDFYQSFHAELNKFNLTYNRLTPSVSLKIWDRVVPSAGYLFEYTFLQGESYGMTNEGYAKVLVKEGEQFSTEAKYEYANLTYWDTDLFTVNSDRTGYRNTFGVNQSFSQDKLLVNAYGYGDFERTAKDYWSYDGFRFGAEACYEILKSLQVGVSAAYAERRYRGINSAWGTEERFDQEVDGTVMLSYLLSDRVGITVSNSTTRNFSNLGLFDYTRNITGIFLTVGVL